jgi:predicted phage tail protein
MMNDCTTCNDAPLAGAFERDMLAATFVQQTVWSAGAGAVLGFLRLGPLGASIIVGGGAYLLARLNEPELIEQAPLGQFFWMGAVAAGAVVLERAIVGG